MSARTITLYLTVDTEHDDSWVADEVWDHLDDGGWDTNLIRFVGISLPSEEAQ